MGLSTLKGNSGYIGLDYRSTSDTTVYGNISTKKNYLERLNGRLGPIIPTDPFQLFFDDFEDGTLDKWTVVNDTESYWVANTAQNSTYPLSSGGTYSAYITANGTSFTYGNNSHSHIYFDFLVPADATSLTLDFDWMCKGEGSTYTKYDYGYVSFVNPSVTTPTTSAAVSNSYRVGGETNSGYHAFDEIYNILADTQYVHETIIINSSTTNWAVGTTRRIIFSWVSDGSLNYPPPFGIDNVKLKYSV